MDLDLQFDILNGFELILDTTVSQEETQEAIVPDASPDILRILDTRAQCFLTGKQVRDGMVTISGQVRSCVFYQPEGTAGIEHIELNLPFVCQAEHSGVSSHANILAFPRVCWAETRMLNPRKVLLRVDLSVSVQAYHEKQLGICCSAVQDASQGVHQLEKEDQIDFVVSVQEKPFIFSDTIEFGLSSADPGEVLGIYGTPVCAEYKLIGSKLIFKGSVEIEVLVMEGAQSKCLHHSMAFSQIMEISGAGETCFPEVRVILTDISFEQADLSNDGGEITLELLAQAAVHERRTVNYLADLYSTTHQMDVHNEIQPLHQCVQRGVRTIPVRELMETPTLVRMVVHAWADVGQICAYKDTDRFSVGVQIQINMMYLDDADQIQTIHHTVSVPCQLESGCTGHCQCWCQSPMELFVSPAAGGAEVRFSLDVNFMVMDEHPINMVLSASMGEERRRTEGESPSMILRLAAPGEQLWDIAKHYATTMEEIIRANELEEEDLPRGKMLLIPKSR